MLKHHPILLRSLVFLLTPWLCFSCTIAPEHPQKELKEAKKTYNKYKPEPAVPYYDVDAYVKQLSLAKLSLETASADKVALRQHLSIVQSFANEKLSEAVYQPVIVISYNTKRKKDVQQVLAPFTMSGNTPGFPDLVEISDQLDAAKFTLQDVHPFVLTYVPYDNLSIPEGDTLKTTHAINKALDKLLESKTKLSDIDEADVQIRLLQFFMQHNARDAAYLAADNARNALAEAEDNNRDPDNIKSLSDQLDVLNTQLRNQMPFTLKNAL